jgi:hypothetical protein
MKDLEKENSPQKLDWQTDTNLIVGLPHKHHVIFEYYTNYNTDAETQLGIGFYDELDKIRFTHGKTLLFRNIVRFAIVAIK